MKRCECMTLQDRRCKNDAIENTRFCHIHTPCYSLMMKRLIPQNLRAKKKVFVAYNAKSDSYNYTIANEFSPSDFKDLLKVIAFVKPNTSITFYDIQFPQNSIVVLSEVLSRTKNIVKIHLLDHSKNIQLKHLARRIVSSKMKLQVLHIDVVYSTPKGLKDLLERIQKNTGIRTLILGGNVQEIVKSKEIINSLTRNVYLHKVIIPNIDQASQISINKITSRNKSISVLVR